MTNTTSQTMNNFRATPEQWYKIEQYANSNCAIDVCLLELRARVEALEAQAGNYPVIPDSSTPPTVATDEELYRIWESKKTDNWDRRRDIYNLGVAHAQARSREVAEPATVTGGLVEQVSWLIADFASMAMAGEDCTPFAVKVILEVARWLREQRAECSADLLEQEAR